MDAPDVIQLLDWLYQHSDMLLTDVDEALSTPVSANQLNSVQQRVLRRWLRANGRTEGNSADFAELRPSWDELYLRIASLMAERATCPRRACGAVIVSLDNQILSSGYNGAVRGEPHCSDVGCRIEGGHCVRAVHAEANALIQGARLGTPLAGATLYATDRPCVRCAGLIIQAGIRSVVYGRAYASDGLDTEVQELFKRANVAYSYLVAWPTEEEQP